MAEYTISQIEIKGTLAVDVIKTFQLSARANCHGYVSYSGYINQQKASALTRSSISQEVMKIYLDGALEFCGHPVEVSIEEVNQVYTLYVTLAGQSKLMDIIAQERFFQTPGQTYEDILTETFKASSNSSLLIFTADTKPVGHPILQYHETDWMFSLRMAGNLSTVVIPNILSDLPQLSLGMPKRKKIIEEYAPRILRQGEKNYLDKHAPYMRKYRYDDINIHICSKHHYQLGDCVLYRGQELFVTEKHIAYHHGQLVDEFVLSTIKGARVPLHYNKLISGLELEGKVLQTKNTVVKPQLDIDMSRSLSGSMWFQFAPVTNNGMYSMPIPGEKIALQWQSERDEDVLITRCCRTNSNKMPTPDKRYLATEHKNSFSMLPSYLDFCTPIGTTCLHHGNGIKTKAEEKIKFKAKRDINMLSSQIDFLSTEKIDMAYSPESRIDMSATEIHLLSDNVEITSDPKHAPLPALAPPDSFPSFKIDLSLSTMLLGATPTQCDVRLIDERGI